MNIILLGPPGAGKGTQAKVLAAKINLPHIATGDILRQNVAEGTELGRKAQGFMNKGELVPDTLVTQMVLERIGAEDTQVGFILDGYPRNLTQAESLNADLKRKSRSIDIVFYLDASEEVIIQRLSGRLVCTKCGSNFHVKNMPPKIAMICDKCGSPLYHRSDDNEGTIRNRLEVYRKESHPLIEYYRSKKALESIAADNDPVIVLDEMVRLINDKRDSIKV
ncbi:MAG: adenylate kinase [Candidatus Omnitrophota bacterium]|jgi:adenylate kinase